MTTPKTANNRVFQANVYKTEVVAEGVLKLTIKIASPFSYQPWQYVWIELLAMPFADLAGNRRAFSILNADCHDNSIDIIARISQTGYKQSLFALKVGDEVRVHGPFGQSFRIDHQHQPKNLIMITGGVGIAAFLPIIKTISDKNLPINCNLIYLNDNPQSTPFLNELADLKAQHKNFDYLVKYERFSWADVQNIATQPNYQAKWWLTGPQDMINHVFTELNTNGISIQNMEFENFYPAHADGLTLEMVQKQIANEGLLTAAIQSSTNHIVITDPNGLILFANKAAEKTTGFSLNEMLGNTPRLWGGLMSPEFYKKLWHSKLSGESIDTEIINRRKNGQIYTAMAHISPIRNTSGAIIGYVASEEDITHLKDAEQKIIETADRLKFALQGSRDGLWDWNIADEKVYFSPRWKQMLGFADDEIQGSVEEWRKRVHPDDLDEVETILNDHLEGKTPYYESEHRVLCKDGTYKWILDRGMVTTRDESGRALRAVGTHTDITDRKLSEELLFNVTKRLEIATKSANIGIWEMDLTNNDLNWDDQMFKLYGVTRQSSSNAMTIKEKGLLPGSKTAWQNALALARSKAVPFDLKYDVTWPDGSVHFLQAYAYIEQDEQGKGVKAIGVSWDVTREHEIDKEKSEFVSLASHQLRTPLTSVRWNTELLLEDKHLTDDQRSYIQEIYEGNLRMIELVNSLLNISRIDLDTFNSDRQPINLAEITQNVIDDLKALSIKHQITISPVIDDNLPSYLADANILKIIITNLLSNAIKYSNPGSTASIDIRILPAGSIIGGKKINIDCLTITVTNAGIGIPDDQKTNIYTKMFRADNAQSTETDGTGLGLYIVKEIVEKNHGLTWFISEENRQTAFFIVLPATGMIEKSGTSHLS